MDIEIKEENISIQDCARIASNSFLSDPAGHIKIIWGGRKSDSVRARYAKIFELLLSQEGRLVIGAFRGEYLVGFICGYSSKHYDQKLYDQIKFNFLFAYYSRVSLFKFAAFQSLVDANTPTFKHMYLGPLCVDANSQGLGVGSKLIEYYLSNYCVNSSVFLETGKQRNVPLYERFGFEVTAQCDFKTEPVWFMQRNKIMESMPSKTMHMNP